ncbi:MAG: hypothetical protein ACI9RO_001870 [Alteromonas macleodii]|jgi:hypothetical protein|tara:strand:+ start:76 stop:321 length:246 start_codon:yes stop_codon:yes gene_type:complete
MHHNFIIERFFKQEQMQNNIHIPLLNGNYKTYADLANDQHCGSAVPQQWSIFLKAYVLCLGYKKIKAANAISLVAAPANQS